LPFGTTLPRTFAFDLKYDVGSDTLLVATLGRGSFTLAGASSVVFGDNRLFGAAPSDQAFQLEIRLQLSANSGTTANFTVGATSGNFTLTYNNVDTAPLAVGSAAAAVQAALEGLAGIGAGHVTVNQAGSVYTVTFTGGPDVANLTAQEVMLGTVRRTSSPAEFAAALQTQMAAALALAGEAGVTPTVTLDTNGRLVIGQTGAFGMKLHFTQPIVAQAGGTRVTLSA